MELTQIQIGNTKLVPKFNHTLSFPIISFSSPPLSLCGICKKGLDGTGYSPISPSSESFFCFLHSAINTNNSVVHGFHEWCLQDFFYENPLSCPSCDTPMPVRNEGMNRVIRIGIDIGGVIIKKAQSDEDTSFFKDDFLKTAAEPDAFVVIAEIVKKYSQKNNRKEKEKIIFLIFNIYGKENIFLVSKAGASIQSRTEQWLNNRNFFEQTSFLEQNIHFCKTRAEKANILNLKEYFFIP